MADVNRLLTRYADYAVGAPSAGAASFTIPLDYSDHRAALVVNNRNASIIRVKLAAGDSIRADLGDLDVDIAANSMGVIPLTDSARFKNMSTNKVSGTLVDTDDVTLGATPLSNIDMIVAQG